MIATITSVLEKNEMQAPVWSENDFKIETNK